jgi:hypothetical protein
MNEQQGFIKASALEREKMTQLFKQNNVIHYEFTPTESYDRIDGYYTGKTGSEYVFEIKCRENPASAYCYNTAIELSKVEYMQTNTLNINHEPIVFFFYTDNQCYFERLEYDKKYNSFKALAPKTTCGDQTMVLKDFVGFNINKKNLIKLKTN